MSLSPLLNASPAIQLHAFAAMSAFVLGAIQLGGTRAACRIAPLARSGCC